MKASELKAADLAGYLRIEPEDLDGAETAMLDAFLNAARNYAQNYTGQTIDAWIHMKMWRSPFFVWPEICIRIVICTRS